MGKLAVILVGFLFVAASLIIGVILNGFVLSMLWGWFMVPVFGLPELSIVAAVGISLTIRYLTHQEQEKNDDNKKTDKTTGEKVTIILKPFLPSLGALLIGYILHLCM